jgi:hypothetical protein
MYKNLKNKQKLKKGTKSCDVKKTQKESANNKSYDVVVGGMYK